MPTLLGLWLALSLAVLLVAAAMERSAILGRVNGANGLFALAALVVSALGSVAAAVAAAWVGGWAVLPAALAASALYHWAMAKVLVGGLGALAKRMAAAQGPAERAGEGDGRR